MSTGMLFILSRLATKPLLLLLVGFGGLLNLGQQQRFGIECLPSPELADGSGLSLGLGLAPVSQQQQQQQQQQETLNTPALERILADNYDGDFSITEQRLESMNKALSEFAVSHGLNQADLVKGQEISRWLAAHGTSAGQNQLLANQATEIDFIFSTFWVQFMPLVQRIVTEKPDRALSLNDLAYRCEDRSGEIQALHELASKSSIYRIFLDIFSTELYIHCLRRKVATFQLNHIEPPSDLRSLVDVYLELPLSVAHFKLSNPTVAATYAHYGLNFNLERAISLHGPIEQALQAELLNTMSFGGANDSGVRALASKIKNQCASYTNELVQRWGNLDEIAAYLSSETNNLADLNNRSKFAQPHLIYASICNQLLQVRP